MQTATLVRRGTNPDGSRWVSFDNGDVWDDYGGKLRINEYQNGSHVESIYDGPEALALFERQWNLQPLCAAMRETAERAATRMERGDFEGAAEEHKELALYYKHLRDNEEYNARHDK